MAKSLAKRVHYKYIDTGAMYRAVTLFCIKNGLVCKDGSIDIDNLSANMNMIDISFRIETNGQQMTYLNGECVENEIRGMEVSNLVSPVAAIGFVRQEMVSRQRAMGLEKGIVMDGRDIGTTVFPDADLKVFVTASDTVRAQRRFDELKKKGETVIFEEILANVRERDYIDSHRAVSPLVQAPDALVLDNSNMTMQEQDEWLLEQFYNTVRRNDYR